MAAVPHLKDGFLAWGFVASPWQRNPLPLSLSIFFYTSPRSSLFLPDAVPLSRTRPIQFHTPLLPSHCVCFFIFYLCSHFFFLVLHVFNIWKSYGGFQLHISELSTTWHFYSQKSLLQDLSSLLFYSPHFRREKYIYSLEEYLFETSVGKISFFFLLF